MTHFEISLNPEIALLVFGPCVCYISITQRKRKKKERKKENEKIKKKGGGEAKQSLRDRLRNKKCNNFKIFDTSIQF